MEITKEKLELAASIANHKQLMVMYKVVKSERDALTAQVEALRREIQSAADWFSAYWPELNKAQCDRIRQMDSVAKATPQQHLAEVKAQAGLEGFIAGSEQTAQFITGEIGYAVPLLEARANQYADSIRRG